MRDHPAENSVLGIRDDPWHNAQNWEEQTNTFKGFPREWGGGTTLVSKVKGHPDAFPLPNALYRSAVCSKQFVLCSSLFAKDEPFLTIEYAIVLLRLIEPPAGPVVSNTLDSTIALQRSGY